MEGNQLGGLEKRRRGDARVEGGAHANTLLAATAFLAALAADPVVAQEGSRNDTQNPATRQEIDPKAALDTFMKGVEEDFKKKGINEQLQGTALSVLQTLLGEGAKALQQMNDDVKRKQNRIEKEKRP